MSGEYRVSGEFNIDGKQTYGNGNSYVLRGQIMNAIFLKDTTKGKDIKYVLKIYENTSESELPPNILKIE